MAQHVGHRTPSHLSPDPLFLCTITTLFGQITANSLEERGARGGETEEREGNTPTHAISDRGHCPDLEEELDIELTSESSSDSGPANSGLKHRSHLESISPAPGRISPQVSKSL